MDIRMPELDGIAATREVTSPRPTPAILILTTFDLDEYVYAAVRAGASGFLLKDTPPDDLVHAVRVIADGEALLAPSVTRRLIEEFVAGSTELSTVAGLDELTEREHEVLVLMARHVERRDRRATGARRDDDQDPRQSRPPQARRPRPGPGRRRGVRNRTRFAPDTAADPAPTTPSRNNFEK
ncbi:MAG: response regulator transcription factor [Ilumatobacteraceae bacterium]